MTPVIPFISKASADERKIWRTALPAALSGIGEVKPFAELTDADKAMAKVAIVANPDPDEVAALPNLEWVQSLWAGVERLTAELPEDGPRIVRLTDPQLAETMSEAVLAWTLYLHRDMPRYQRQQRDRIWQDHQLKLPGERTVGILGLGKLGTVSALRLKANGFNVIGWSRQQKNLSGIECLAGQDGLLNVLQHSDILVVLVPLTPETHGLLDAERLSACKKGAAIINFARGPVIETSALLNALDRAALDHAVLDVFDVEPLPADSPLWAHEKVTVLPHISAPTITSTACRIVADNIGGYFSSGAIPQSVDRRIGY